MGFFNKKNKTELPGAFDHIGIEPETITVDPVNYNTVLDYLVGLSNRDFEKLNKVAGIYRQANKDAARALGIKDEPTTAIHDLKDELQTQPPVVISSATDDVDDIADQLLLDDEPEFLETPNEFEPKKIQVKNGTEK